MEKDELLQTIKAMADNGKITLAEIAEYAGLENKLRNMDDEEREKLVADLTEALGVADDELLAKAKELLLSAEEADEAVAEQAANSLVGSKTITNALGVEDENPCYTYAKSQLHGKHGKELKNAVEALKSDKVLSALRSNQANTKVSLGAGNAAGAGNAPKVREV